MRRDGQEESLPGPRPDSRSLEAHAEWQGMTFGPRCPFARASQGHTLGQPPFESRLRESRQAIGLGLLQWPGPQVLAVLFDRRGSEPAFDRGAAAHLFPSDRPVGQFAVTFGNGLSNDGFGFVRKGTVSVRGNTLVCDGSRNWSAAARFGVFLLVCALPAVLSRGGIAILPGLIAVHFICVTRSPLELAMHTIRNVERDGKVLSFYAEHPQTRARRLCLFRLDSEDEALACERALTRDRLPRAA